MPLSMKHRLRFFLTSCAALVITGCSEPGPSAPPPPPAVDAPRPESLDDHGNAQESATRIGSPSSTEGVLEIDGDIDFFLVPVRSEGVLTVTTTGDTDTVGTVFLPDGTEITNDDASSTQEYHEQNFSITQKVMPGNHYVSVQGWCGDEGCETGEYVLHVLWVPPAEDDHGNNALMATPVRLPSSTPGRFERSDDTDFFRLEVPSVGGLLTVTTTGDIDTGGYLYFPGGTFPDGNSWNRYDGRYERDDDSGIGQNFKIEVRVLEAGTYYVEVQEWVGWGARSRAAKGDVYYLHVTLTEPEANP